ncbi:MAG: thioesterase family protein [Leptolyngbyaceae cyanobacterium bins.302]|nr:thioesterase family protein [Leptolyngbyaceae cyanobacterium bins.302]
MQKIAFELEVYSFHIDLIGHVNSAIYIQWMEIGRTKLLEAIGMPAHQLFQQGIAPVLAQTNITYKSPLYMGDRVQVELWLSELKNASTIIQFNFYNDQKTLVAEGWQKALFVDRQTMRPRRFLLEERALFAPYMHSTVDTRPVDSPMNVPKTNNYHSLGAALQNPGHAIYLGMGDRDW